jgi:hypothetical protein
MHYGSHPKHGVASNDAILVNADVQPDVSASHNVAMTSKQSRVRKRYVLLQQAVMRDMAASHQISEFSNNRLAFNASMNRDEFSNHATITNLNAKLLLFASVLWR